MYMSFNIAQIPSGSSASLSALSARQNENSDFSALKPFLTPVQQGQVLAFGDTGGRLGLGLHFTETPVQQGERLARADTENVQNLKAQSNSAPQTQTATCSCPSCCGVQTNAPTSDIAQTAQNNSANRFPNMFNNTASDAVSVSTEVTQGLHGRTRTTHTITIRANYSYGDGVSALPGETIQQEAARQAQKIENTFGGTYTDALGNETVYNTRVDMTVNQPTAAGRMNIVIVNTGDSRLAGDNFVGPPPPRSLGRASMEGTTSGNTYISATSGGKTVPHEVGHILGFRHNYQTTPDGASCAAITPGPEANIMSQSGCAVGETVRLNGRINIRLVDDNGNNVAGQADFSITQSQLQQLVDRHKCN
jgi:hypothetical protein